MIYTCSYQAPMGAITASAQDDAITGLWFDGQKYFPSGTQAWSVMPDYPVFAQLNAWLDAYFAGENPAVTFALAPRGSQFRQNVWRILREIPYGQTTTYGTIAKQLADARCSAAQDGDERNPKDRDRRAAEGSGGRVVAAQAVGGAVGHNPISIVIPCHRVLGSTGSLTGYAGGLDKKIALLELEGIAHR
ncbi:MAG: methylated-DNA--[protein]-cysteine S-methyltransferase [Coriobacteriales bacterium]|jgi:methylated-DNA-[protein]-cysteine S-methyltransferase|nr:methylated-DNA--[protein]-cysteine S-methyltransferase [Coriobacteriales bacterium]